MFNILTPIGEKAEKQSSAFFNIYSGGVKTNRDNWCYNFSEAQLRHNITQTIDTYNNERIRYESSKKESDNVGVEEIVNRDPTKISWSGDLLMAASRQRALSFVEDNIVVSLYRPFCKQYLYFDRILNNSIYQIPKLFPMPQHRNRVICVSGVGVTKEFSCVITDVLPDLELIGKSQCFPLYWYDESTKDNVATLFSTPNNKTDKYVRQDGVSDYLLKRCQEKYHKSLIAKEDVFYYVYGILHSPTYRETFSSDLKKMLPRLPLVDSLDDFRAFCNAGCALADLHLNYETVEPCKCAIVTYSANDRVDYRIESMSFGKNGKVEDKSTIRYNHQITISNIPLDAYDYIVNGKSAIEWIMERYAVKTNKNSGICNDPNNWAEEHGDEKYILNLLLSVITVSLETNKIVAALPKLYFE